MTFYVLRYSPDVPMDQRPHEPTVGRFATWLEAEDRRLTLGNRDDLQVEERTEPKR